MARPSRLTLPADFLAAGDVEGLIAFNRALFGSTRMEGDDGDGGSGTGDGGGGSGGTSGSDGSSGGSGSGTGSDDRGYPANTPVSEMTADQQVAYWKHQARKHETTAKARGDYDDLKAKAARLAELEAANATEQEKAVKAARDEAAAEERRKTAPQIVRAEFRAAAKGVLTDEQRDALLEDLDLTKYLTDKGEVDVEKVEKKVAAFAPKGDDGGADGDQQRRRRVPDLGQGRRQGTAQPSVASGADRYAERHGKKKTTTAT